MDRLLDTSALTKAQKTDLVSYRNQLNPASITRRIIELQDVLIRPAKDKTSRLRPARTPKRSDRRPQEHPGQEGPNHPSPTDILNRGAEELTREP